jgi:hypothetical protein
MGCGPKATIDVDLPETDWGTMQAWNARICRNDICASGSFATLPANPEVGLGYPVSCTGLPAGEAFQSHVKLPGTLHIEWNDGQIKNGDRYTVTVTDAAGAKVASFDRTTSYTNVEAGNDSCGLTCPHATF